MTVSRTLMLLLGILALGLKTSSADAALGPTKINGCQTISVSGSYAVDGNIAATGNCLVVAADFVTIDLSGFTMTGNGTGTAILGAGGPRQGTSILNGTIRNFAAGIDFCSSPGSLMRVERMLLVNNSSRAVCLFDHAIVKDNIAFGNGDGIRVGSASIVTGNTAGENNGEDGISASGGSVVVGNASMRNGGPGAPLGGRGIFAGAGSTVGSNAASFNVSIGLSVSSASTIVNNASFANNGIGIAAGIHSVVRSNAATDNDGDALHVNCTSNVLENAADDLATVIVTSPCNVEHNDIGP